MFSQLRGWEWLIIVALILLLFGAKRLPDAARGLGRSLRIFKAETKGLVEDGSTPEAVAPAADQAITAAPPVQPAPPVQQPAPAQQAAPAQPETERAEG